MNSPALTIGWELRQRHRWGLRALGAYLAVMVVIKVAALADSVTLDTPDSFAFVVVVPITSIFLYFLAVFTYGLSGDFAARESMYPSRTFTLPVTASALAGWPMLYGGVAMVVLWGTLRFLAVWPAGMKVPVFWPGLLAVVLLAWTQALTWMPYPLRGLRVGVTVLWLTMIDAAVITALEMEVSEGVMLALLAPHVPLAYLVARKAVTKARHGEVPDWRGLFDRASRVVVIRRNSRPFATAAQAQMWFEWRQYGRSLPLLVAILLPFQLSMLFLFSETPLIIFETLGMVLLTPAFMASFVAATVGRDGAAGSEPGLPPFQATRAMSNASLIASKLKVTVASTLAAWALLLGATVAAVKFSGTAPVVLDLAIDVEKAVGTPRAIAIGVLALVTLVATTWKQLVQSLYIRMSGREGLIKGSVFATLAIITVGFFVLQWVIRDRGAVSTLMRFASLAIPIAVGLKLAAGSWVALRLGDEGLVSDGLMLAGAALWTATVFTLYGVLVWIVPEIVARSWYLMLLAMLAVPLARISAAPLALARNRHR